MRRRTRSAVPRDRVVARPLGEVFDPRRNSLNALRLLLALIVIVWHSFPLTGRDIDFWPLRQALGEIPVDGFFAISGFLIVSSWVRDPDWRRYLLARALRILPALWVCLIITASVIAPLSALFSGGTVFSGSNVGYVLSNLGVTIIQPGIDGTLVEVPYPTVWNGSLWTLRWECFCYLGVLALGIVGALRARGTYIVVFTISLIALVATSYGPIDHAMVVTGARFAIMFASGALVYCLRSWITLGRIGFAVASAVLACSLMLPDYRLLGALPLAYLVIGLGARITAPHLRTDVSYGVYIYAFPVQQTLASLGGDQWPVVGFILTSTLLTLPLAFGSWFAVEKPVMDLRRRFATRKTVASHPRKARRVPQRFPATD